MTNSGLLVSFSFRFIPKIFRFSGQVSTCSKSLPLTAPNKQSLQTTKVFTSCQDCSRGTQDVDAIETAKFELALNGHLWPP